MYEARNQFDMATPADVGDALASVRAMRAMFGDLAAASSENIASQQAIAGASADPLALRYAAASPITRRRFDALLREAESVATVGLRLVMGRNGRVDVGTIAAAQFLGRSLDSAIGKLDALLPVRAH